MKTNLKPLLALLLAVLLCGSLAGCGKKTENNPTGGNSVSIADDGSTVSAPDAVSDATDAASLPATEPTQPAALPTTETAAEPTNAAEADKASSAIAALLQKVHDRPADYYEGGSADTVESNRFAIADINNDGQAELLIDFSATYNAAMYMGVWQYDAQADTLERTAQFNEACEFYSDGTVKALASHNQGNGEDVWPYDLLRYNTSAGAYEVFASGYCENKSLSGDAFPDEKDTDGDGVLYFFTLQGEEMTLTKDEYQTYVDTYCPESRRLTISWQSLTEANIAAIA